MSVAQDLTWVLRGIGVFYVVGGLVLINQLRINRVLDRAIKQINAMAEEMNPGQAKPLSEDTDREIWLWIGALLTIAAGVTMALASRWAVWALAVLVIHQAIYFTRQRFRELRAKTAEEALDARPATSTRNAFVVLTLVAIFAAWLDYQRALS